MFQTNLIELTQALPSSCDYFTLTDGEPVCPPSCPTWASPPPGLTCPASPTPTTGSSGSTLRVQTRTPHTVLYAWEVNKKYKFDRFINFPFKDFHTGDNVRRLACLHLFHVNCVDNWLGRNRYVV